MGSETALLIGIGNPLRGDDGVGGFLVDELAREWEAGRPHGAERRAHLRAHLSVHLKSVHQLSPELALLVADASRVLFVDAWASPGPTRPWIDPLQPPPLGGPSRLGAGPGSHGLDPVTLLLIAEGLYGWRGEGALLRVPAQAFPHGPGFSAPLKRALPRARELLRRWLRGGEPAGLVWRVAEER